MASTELPITESTAEALTNEWTSSFDNSTQNSTKEDNDQTISTERTTEHVTEGTSETGVSELSSGTSELGGTDWTTDQSTDSSTSRDSTGSFVTFTTDSRTSTQSVTKETGTEWTQETETFTTVSTNITDQETSATGFITTDSELDTSTPPEDYTEPSTETREVPITTEFDSSTTETEVGTSPSEDITSPVEATSSPSEFVTYTAEVTTDIFGDITSTSDAITSPAETATYTIGETRISEAVTDSTDFSILTTGSETTDMDSTATELPSTESETRTVESETEFPSTERGTRTVESETEFPSTERGTRTVESETEFPSTESETRTIESVTDAVTTESETTPAFVSESAGTTQSDSVTSVSEEATTPVGDTTVLSTEDGTSPETSPTQGATVTDFSDFSTNGLSDTTVTDATEVFVSEDDRTTTQSSETTTTTTQKSTTQETTASEATTTTSQRTTNTEPVVQTTEPSGVCDDGFFGHECAYQCNCFDPDEVCDKLTGHCQSGCQTGYEGPGCLIDSTSSVDELVIIMGTLAGLFFLTLIFVIILFCCLRKNKTKKAQNATVLDDNMDFVALNMLPSQDPFKEIKAYVPRLKSEDAQIFDEFLGDGRFGPIYRGILHEENNTKTVAYKALKVMDLLVQIINEEPLKYILYYQNIGIYIGKLSSSNFSDDATQREKKAFYAQMELYASFERHENVLAFYGIAYFAERVFGGYEYAEHETLKFYLRRVHKGSIKLGTGESVPTDADVRDHLVSLGIDVATGMRHLASRGIVHRELAAKHVMVDSNHVAKIAGLNSLKGAMPISQRWMAPEVIENNMNTLKSDVWSYGIVLWEIMNQCQNRPYTEMGSQDVLRFVNAGNRLKRPPGCEKAVFALMKWCWSMEPDKRPDFVRVVDALKEILYSGEHGNKAQRMGSFLNMADSKDIELSLEDSLPLTSASPNGSTLKAVTPTPSISAANSVNASPALKTRHKGEENLAFTPDSAV